MQTINQIIREVKRLREEIDILKNLVKDNQTVQHIEERQVAPSYSAITSVQEGEGSLVVKRGRPRKVNANSASEGTN